ncbi:MAG: hypothetical protein A3B68_09090 [Candidatus Melainabacteria bacterium RIFCSPHIGHO2_02_FULL_34_12]|nr:MAG: hypothetical protein A3B68_09090 [Candidatus Melainabacteria bacterium RIFCSPHIGHO2_02_FULL_34_12]
MIPRTRGSFITNLPAAYVQRFTPANFRDKHSNGSPLDRDPNVSSSELDLGFSQDSGVWHVPEKPPSKHALYKWDFLRDGETGRALVTPLGHGKQEEVFLTPRAEITGADIQWLKNNSLIVDPIAAALAVYKREKIKPGQMIGENAFDYDANERIIKSLLSGGSGCADNLNIPGIPELKNLLGIAAAMDTACRTPDMMSAELIQAVTKWYGENFGEATFWIGAGTENVPKEQRIEAALTTGKITEDDYVKYRLEQIEYILSLGHTPIMFPDQMQNGYGDEQNIALITRMLSQHPNEIVLHKLGSPFNSKTDYLNLAVLQAVAHLAYAVKTSDPHYEQQIRDYNSIRAAVVVGNKNVVMYTGDDRGFPFIWEVGAREQLKESDDVTSGRNDFKFISGKNISALLGYIGLNPRQTIKAIIELSKWFEEESRGVICDHARANQHLDNYWKLMAPAMALSTDCFFGPFDRTPAYTGRVESANRFFGVLRPEDGSVLEHRGPHWEDEIDKQVMDGRLLALLVNAGAITVDDLPTVIGRNKKMLFMPQTP